MHRILTDTSVLGMEEAGLSREGAAHLRVLRPKSGEEFMLFDGRGCVRTYRWDAGRKALTAAGRLERFAPHSEKITLFACVTKGQRWDWTIQKATELGASRIVPVISARTIVRISKGEETAKRERWRRIAEEAAQQSDAIWLPEIAAPAEFAQALEMARETVCFAGALTVPPPMPLLAAVEAAKERTTHASDWSAFIGPEGDFTPDELAALLEFATPTNFGPTILRAETAAIFALSVLSAALRS